MSARRTKNDDSKSTRKKSSGSSAGTFDLLGLTLEELRVLGPEKFESLVEEALQQIRTKQMSDINAVIEASNRLRVVGKNDEADALLRAKMFGMAEQAAWQRAVTSKFARMLFGPRSEKLDAEELRQLCLAFGVTEEAFNAAVKAGVVPDVPVAEPPTAATDGEDAPAVPRKKNETHRGRRPLTLSSAVTVVETVRPVEGDEKSCALCGKDKRCIGHVRHERIEIVPPRLELHVELREVVACDVCRADAVTAERSDPELSRRRVGTSICADLIAEKCSEAQPVHRQKARYERLGWSAPEGTIDDAYRWATDLLTPIADVVRGEVLRENYVQADSTTLLVVDPKLERGKSTGQVWAFVSRAGVAFDFTANWSAQAIAPSFAVNWDGYKQVDDYAGYGSLVVHEGLKRQLVPDSLRLGCMMHVRRRFHEAFKQKDARAAVPIELIRRLYKIEEHARGFDPEARLRHRTEHARPVLDKFWEWIDARHGTLPPKTLLGSAVRYASDQREFVERCYTRGEFEIDNGAPERAIKSVAIGRKNFMFSGSLDAAARLSAAYTLVVNAKQLGLDPFFYLRDVLDRFERGFPITRVAELTPRAFAAAKAAK